MDILNTILKDTYTQAQLNHRLNTLKSYLLQSFFRTQQKQPLEQADLSWLKSLPASVLQKFNKDNFYQIFNQLNKQVSGLKGLTVYLALEADDASLAAIGRYARKLFGDYLVLDIKYDPTLIAGAALVWQGVYKDYSLRSKIYSKRDQISQNFKKYLK